MNIFKFGEENNDLGHGEERFNNLKARAEASWGDDDELILPKCISDLFKRFGNEEKE